MFEKPGKKLEILQKILSLAKVGGCLIIKDTLLHTVSLHLGVLKKTSIFVPVVWLVPSHSL